jgi:hypothetical protein
MTKVQRDRLVAAKKTEKSRITQEQPAVYTTCRGDFGFVAHGSLTRGQRFLHTTASWRKFKPCSLMLKISKYSDQCLLTYSNVWYVSR